MNCDVLIIGGGIAGLSLAARLGGQGTVIVVEAEPTLAYHTSSRSARQMQPSYGPPAIRALTARSIEQVDGISGDIGRRILSPRPLIFVGSQADVTAKIAASDHLKPISTEETLERAPDLRPEYFAAAALDDGALQVEVDVLVDYYRRRALAAGVRIECSVPVHTAQHSGSAWSVGAGQETFDAGVVVDAAGAWADPVAAIFGVQTLGLEPHRRTAAIASTTKPVPPDGHMVIGADDSFYYRPEGTQLLISPRESVPSRAEDAKPIAADVEKLVRHINGVTTLGLTGIERSWTGLRTEHASGMPVVGFDKEVAGFFWLAGQGGYGIQTSWAMADLAGSLIDGTLGGDDPIAADLSPLR